MDMDFYRSWKLHQKQGYDCSEYVVSFLKKEKCTLDVLQYGAADIVREAVTAILTTPFERFIHCIRGFSFSRDVMPAEVPQFSAFEDGVEHLLELLQFAPNGLTFDEAGYQLVKSKTAVAQKKYGENHSKLAEMMSLVTISIGGSNDI